ncbi:MAG TPA: DUF481 domain-containing protein [Acidobacteriota bacterium]|nr:DUF481 domain-containing protein [Acidobacteriota bacterium]
MRGRALWMLAAWLLALTAWATGQAVRVKMKNGDVLSGTLVALDGSRAVFRTDYAPGLELPLERVAEVTGNAAVRLQLDDDTTLRTTLTGWADGVFHLASGDHTFTLAQARVRGIALEPAAAEPTTDLRAIAVRVDGLDEVRPKRWSGAVNFGYTLARGNASSDDLYLRTAARYARQRDTFSASAHTLYGVLNEATSRNEVYGSFRYDYKLPKRYFVFGSVSGEYDEVEGIDLRHTWNAGVGYSLITRPALSLDVGTGVGFLQEVYPSLSNRSDGSTLLEGHLNWKLNDRVAFTQNLLVIPYLTGDSRYRTILDATLNLTVNRMFKFNIGMLNRYDSRPLPDVEHNDFTMFTGVGWIF